MRGSRFPSFWYLLHPRCQSHMCPGRIPHRSAAPRGAANGSGRTLPLSAVSWAPPRSHICEPLGRPGAVIPTLRLSARDQPIHALPTRQIRAPSCKIRGSLPFKPSTPLLSPPWLSTFDLRLPSGGYRDFWNRHFLPQSHARIQRCKRPQLVQHRRKRRPNPIGPHAFPQPGQPPFVQR